MGIKLLKPPNKNICRIIYPYLDCGSKSPRALSTLFCLKTFRTSLTFTLIVKYLGYRIDSRLLCLDTLPPFI